MSHMVTIVPKDSSQHWQTSSSRLPEVYVCLHSQNKDLRLRVHLGSAAREAYAHAACWQMQSDRLLYHLWVIEWGISWHVKYGQCIRSSLIQSKGKMSDDPIKTTKYCNPNIVVLCCCAVVLAWRLLRPKSMFRKCVHSKTFTIWLVHWENDDMVRSYSGTKVPMLICGKGIHGRTWALQRNTSYCIQIAKPNLFAVIQKNTIQCTWNARTSLCSQNISNGRLETAKVIFSLLNVSST